MKIVVTNYENKTPSLPNRPNSTPRSIFAVALDDRGQLKLVGKIDFYETNLKCKCYLSFYGKSSSIYSFGIANGGNFNLEAEALEHALINAGFSLNANVRSFSRPEMEATLEAIARWGGYTVVKAVS